MLQTELSHHDVDGTAFFLDLKGRSDVLVIGTRVRRGFIRSMLDDELAILKKERLLSPFAF